MKVILTTPYLIKFPHSTLDSLYGHAMATDQSLEPGIFIEDIVEVFYDINLDYDEENDLYIIYFDSEGDKTMFLIQYSELLDGVQS